MAKPRVRISSGMCSAIMAAMLGALERQKSDKTPVASADCNFWSTRIANLLVSPPAEQRITKVRGLKPHDPPACVKAGA